MPIEQIIQFQVDGIRLTGTLHMPDKATRSPFVIGCHGLLADRSSPKQIALADALNNIGMAYFRFDHRGCGNSQGPFDTRHLLSSRCSDLSNAIQTMQRHDRLGNFAGLFGSSFGGTVVLATAASRKVPRLATYAAPVSSHAIRKPTIKEIKNNPIGNSDGNAYEFDITAQLCDLSHILVMHGEKDEIVPIEHAQQIYQTSQTPKKLVIHEGGDHRLSNSVHQKDFLQKCVQWFRPMAMESRR